MVPRSRSPGRQHKISPPGTEPPLTPPLTSPILLPVLSHITIPPHLPPHSQTNRRMGLTGWIYFLCASVGSVWAEELAPAGGREEEGLGVAKVGRVVWSLKESGAAWQWRLQGSPRFRLMAPLGPTYCWWSDGLLQYEATRPGARFHTHFSLSLSKTLNDFPKIGKWEFNRGEQSVEKGWNKSQP